MPAFYVPIQNVPTLSQGHSVLEEVSREGSMPGKGHGSSGGWPRPGAAARHWRWLMLVRKAAPEPSSYCLELTLPDHSGIFPGPSCFRGTKEEPSMDAPAFPGEALRPKLEAT